MAHPGPSLSWRAFRLFGPAGSGPPRLPLILLCCLAASCAPDRPGESPPDPGSAIPPDPAPVIPSDGLLQRSDLQGVVDLGVARDIDALLQALGSEDPVVRARGVRILGSFPDLGGLPTLIRLLDSDPVPEVRHSAAFALGRSGDPRAGGPLLRALESAEDPEFRRLLMEGVGETGDATAMGALARLEVPASEAAHHLLSLGRFANRGVTHPDALAALDRALALPEPTLVAAAAYYPSRHADPEAWAPLLPSIRALLEGASADHPAGPRLLGAIGRLADPADAPRLVRWTREPADWRTRVSAVQALAGMPAAPAAREALRSALDDASEHVALAAARAMGEVAAADPETVTELRERLESGRERRSRVVGALLQALVQAGGGDWVVRWVEALPTRDEASRTEGMLALTRAPGAEARNALLAGAEDRSPSVAGAAVAALAARWQLERLNFGVRERYYRAFVRGTSLSDPRGRHAALRALGDPAFQDLGGGVVLARAYEAMDPDRDEAAMVAILEALAEMADPGVMPLLERAFAGDAPVLRATAAMLLGARGALPPGAEAAPAGPRRPGVPWEELAALGTAPRLILETDRGRIVAVLAPEEAPLTVGALARLAAQGRYDGVPFHRVVPNFVIQGGDVSRGDGSGGPGYRLRTELTRIPFSRGTLGMARSGRDTEGSQFFITHSRQPHLDTGYTAFGWVVEGMEVVDRIQVGDRLLRARVVPGGR